MSGQNPHRNDFMLALAKAQKAMQRGDLAAANQWTRLAERHLVIAHRLATIPNAINPMIPATPRR